MTTTQSIKLDLLRRGEPPRVYAKQGDTGTRAVAVELYCGGVAWTPPNGVKGLIRFRKPDRNAGLYDKLPDGTTPACEITSGSSNFIANLAAEVLTCPGEVYADIAFTAGAELLGTATFVIEVEASPAEGTTPSGSYYNYQTIGAINAAIAALNTAIGKCVRQVNGKDPDANGNVAVNIGVSSINNRTGVVRLPINALAECTTPPPTTIKSIGLIDGFSLLPGAIIAIKFKYSNTAGNPILSYGGNEMPILDRITGQPIAAGDITAGTYRFMASPTGWILLDKQQSSGSTAPVPGDPGEDGGWWIPSVDADGNLTWTASKDGMGDAPAPANIKGLPGADGDPGADGAPGADGQDGGYYIPRIMQPESNIMQIAFDASKSGMTSVQARQIVIPKGDPGQDGAPGPAGDPGPKGDKGDKGDPGSAAIGLGGCNSAANVVNKEISIYTDDFKPIMSAIVTVAFRIENTADNPSLVINNKSYGIIDCRNGQPVKAAAMCGQVHTYVLDPQNSVAFLLDPNTATSSVTLDKTLTQEGQAADAKAAGDAIKNLREFLQGDVELTSLNLTSGLTTDADINVDFGGNRLRGVNDPVEDTDAASKGYVDEQIANISNDGNAVPSAGVCTTAANIAAKVEQGYIKSPIVGGSIVTVEFTNDNTANNPTLDVNGVVGAIVYRSMSAIDPASLTKGIHQFVCLENYNKWMMLDALEWEEIANITVEADVRVVAISKDKDNKPFGLRKAKIMVSAVGSETNTKSANGELSVNGITYYYSPNLPVVGAETSRFIASSLEAITDGLIWHDSSSNNNNTYQTTGTRHTGWIATVESTLRNFAFSAVGGMVIGAGTNIKIMGVRA